MYIGKIINLNIILMALQKIIRENYDSIVKRGLITSYTTKQDFISKLDEEVSECDLALHCGDLDNLKEEIADVILTALNFAQHYDIDIEDELTKKIKKNYERAGNNS